MANCPPGYSYNTLQGNCLKTNDPEAPAINPTSGVTGTGGNTPFFQTGFGNYLTQISTALLGGFGAGVGGQLNNQQQAIVMQRRQENTTLVILIVIIVAVLLFFIFRRKK